MKTKAQMDDDDYNKELDCCLKIGAIKEVTVDLAPKEMGLLKTGTYRSQKLRDAARDQSCVQCGADDGTVVLAHLAWPGIAERGLGHKCHDFWGAHLCLRCHTAADSGEFHTDLYWRTQAVAKTLARLFGRGVIRA